MKKILFVMSSLHNGGAERSLVNLFEEMSPEKYEIDLLLFKKEGMFLSQVPDYVNIFDTPAALKKLYSPVSKAGSMVGVKCIGDIVSKIRTKNVREKRVYRWNHFYGKHVSKLEKKYDVAVAYLSGEVLCYVDEKVDADKKIVWIHNDYRTAQHPKKLDYERFRRMDNIVSVSYGCVDILKEEFDDLKEKIVYLPNITSSKLLKKRADEFYPSEYNEGDNNLLSIGRLNSQKGFDLAINAAAIMKQSNIKFKWFIIGEGELKDNLENMIADNDVGDCVYLLGTRSNPYPYIKNCTILVQPSRYEGKSVVIDEAKILAAPIAVTDYPTVADQVTQGEEGIIMGMNPKNIADSLITMLENKAIRERLQMNLQKKDYGNQDVIKDYDTLFGA